MTPAEGRIGRPRWHSVVASVLITVGCLVAIPATVAVWLDSVVNDTDGYVDAVGPLARDPAVQDAVTARVTDRVMAAVGGSGPVTDRLRSRVEEQVGAVVVAEVQDGLVAAGIPSVERLTAGDADIVVPQSEHLPTARDWLARIDRLGTWLPVATVVLPAAGVVLARSRLRAVAAVGVGLVLSMLALVVLATGVRSRYLGSLSPTAGRDAVAAVYDQLVDPLRTTALTLLATGLVMALIAAVAVHVMRRRTLARSR